MEVIRRMLLLLCISLLCSPEPAATWAQVPEPSGSQSQQTAAAPNLKLTAIGEGALPNGHATAFRVYEDRDGTKGHVVYVEFDSIQDAKQQISDWVKPIQKIVKREHNETRAGQLISDRIIGVAEVPGSSTRDKEFVIVRRDNLTCYLIESSSLQVANDIEGLIEHKLRSVPRR